MGAEVVRVGVWRHAVITGQNWRGRAGAPLSPAWPLEWVTEWGQGCDATGSGMDGAENYVRVWGVPETPSACSPWLHLGLSLLPGGSFSWGCKRSSRKARVQGSRVRGLGNTGMQGSEKVLRHCFWTCSFSWSPPHSHHSQAGEDRGRGLSVHGDLPVRARGNLPRHRNLSVRGDLSS